MIQLDVNYTLGIIFVVVRWSCHHHFTAETEHDCGRPLLPFISSGSLFGYIFACYFPEWIITVMVNQNETHLPIQ